MWVALDNLLLSHYGVRIAEVVIWNDRFESKRGIKKRSSQPHRISNAKGIRNTKNNRSGSGWVTTRKGGTLAWYWRVCPPLQRGNLPCILAHGSIVEDPDVSFDYIVIWDDWLNHQSTDPDAASTVPFFFWMHHLAPVANGFYKPEGLFRREQQTNIWKENFCAWAQFKKMRLLCWFHPHVEQWIGSSTRIWCWTLCHFLPRWWTNELWCAGGLVFYWWFARSEHWPNRMETKKWYKKHHHQTNGFLLFWKQQSRLWETLASIVPPPNRDKKNGLVRFISDMQRESSWQVMLTVIHVNFLDEIHGSGRFSV